MIMRIKIVILFIFIFLTGCGVTHVNYTGDYKGNQYHGLGTLILSNGDKYKGEWKNNVIEGQGTYIWSNGEKYIGEWKKDKRSGFGTNVWVNGEKYIGEWKNGKRNGQGTNTDPNGRIQEGIWKNDKFSYAQKTPNNKFNYALKKTNFDLCNIISSNIGHQILVHKEEVKRRGLDCFALNQQKKNTRQKVKSLASCPPFPPFHNCFGIFKWKTGDKYEGEWKNGNRNGEGVFTWKTGDKYEGEYKDGKRHGQGILTYSNGSKYLGEWKNGKRNGQGTNTQANGKVTEGIWKDNKFLYAQKIKKTNKQYSETSYDDLYASRREAERERKKRIELERKLVALENKQKQEQQRIDTDTRVPLLEIISIKTKGKRGTITGIARDNIEVAEVTVDGKPVSLSSNGNFKFFTYVPSTGVDLKVQVTDIAGLTAAKIVTLKGDTSMANSSISFDRLNPLGKRVRNNKDALALIIGVSNYENTKAKALYADNDALVFKDYATEKLGVSENRIKMLINNGADEKDILLSVKEWLRRSAKPNKSDIYVFFAGHGLASQDGKNMYLLPHDGSPRLLNDTAILRDRLFADLKATNPKSVTVFLDTCYSGETRNEEMLIAGRPIVIRAKEQSIPNGFTLFSAAAGDQTSKPLEEAKHGMFSYFLMKGMEGDADINSDNKITAQELHNYVKENVTQQSSGSQTPELQGNKNRVLVQFNK
ncbi:caspase family protein [Alphaproteobacteria bacterium]|nr:caspase family protein [Alphaproteobacteria bacterium]